MAVYVAAVDGMTSHDAADVTRLETVLLSQEGVVGVTGGDLLVEAQGTPDMTIKVGDGSCFVKRDAHAVNDNTLKFWHVIVTASTNVTITTADPSNPRIDLICVKVDTGASPDATASNVGSLVAVAGTAAGSPSRPSVPNNYLEIAQIAVGTGVTTIVSGNITDTRTFIGLQLPYAHGYRLKDTGGNLDAQMYEDSAGKVLLISGKSGGGVRIDPVSNKVEVSGGGGESWGKVVKFPLPDQAYFDEEVDNGNSGATETINWTNGNKQKSTLSESCTYTFTAPSGPANVILKAINFGAFTPTLPTINWPASTEPTWTASGTDIIALYWDGTAWWGQASLDMG